MNKAIKITALILALVLAFVNVPVTVNAASYAVKIDVTAKKYGAKKNKDSFKAIQTALNDAAKKGKAGKPALVKIPKGTYYISKTLSMGSNTVLELNKDTVIKKKKGSDVFYMLRSAQGTKGKYNDVKNITVKGGTWDAEFKKVNDVSGGSLFFFAHVSGLNIENVTIRNNFGTHLIEMGGVKDVSIKGCKLYGFKAASKDTEKEAIQIDTCHDETILPSGGPFDDTPCTNVVIENNEIHSYPRAIGSHIAVQDLYHKDIIIKNNSIHDISAAAVYAYNYVNLTVEDNRFENVGSGVILKSYSKTAPDSMYKRLKKVKAMTLSNDTFNLTVKNNEISTVKNKENEVESVDGGAKGIFIYGSDEYPIGSCVFDGNTVVSDSSGIYLRYVKNTEIKGNKVDRFAGAYNVEKTEFAEDAIKLLACTDITVSENKISTVNSDRYENGIALRENSTAKIDSNEINSTNKSGIAVYNSSAEGTGNKINAAKKHGVTVQDGTLKLSSCSILGSGEHGACAQESELSLTGCTIEKSTNHGVLADSGSNLAVTDSTISESGKHGICVIDASKATLTGNTILDCKSNGIQIGHKDDATDRKVSVTADGNKIYGCIKGISILSGTSGSVTNNEMYSLGKFEITVEDGINFSPSVKMLKIRAGSDSNGNKALTSRP